MKQKSVAWEYTEIIIIAVVLAVVIRCFFVQAYKIPSGSMMNTLLEGDYLLITRFNYDVKISVPFTEIDIPIVETGEPQHGDIIVFRYPKDTKQDYIKRVIGLPGDTIEIRNKQLFRNGKLVTEPYANFTNPYSNIDGVDNVNKLTVPAGHYFALGDNRDASADSRMWGFVPRENIHGKAWFIYWSWGNGFDVRWNRIGTNLYPDASITGQ
ncbi:MAG: Signal peptidase I [Desulfovibrio sp.]